MLGRLSGGHVKNGVEAEKPKRRTQLGSSPSLGENLRGLNLYILWVENLEDAVQSNCE